MGIQVSTVYRSGDAVVCPIVPCAEEGPLHFLLEMDQVQGYILCEQVHYVNLRRRYYQKLGSTDYFYTMDFSDAVMGIFDYQMMG